MKLIGKKKNFKETLSDILATPIFRCLIGLALFMITSPFAVLLPFTILALLALSVFISFSDFYIVNYAGEHTLVGKNGEEIKYSIIRLEERAHLNFLFFKYLSLFHYIPCRVRYCFLKTDESLQYKKGDKINEKEYIELLDKYEDDIYNFTFTQDEYQDFLNNPSIANEDINEIIELKNKNKEIPQENKEFDADINKLVDIVYPQGESTDKNILYISFSNLFSGGYNSTIVELMDKVQAYRATDEENIPQLIETDDYILKYNDKLLPVIIHKESVVWIYDAGKYATAINNKFAQTVVLDNKTEQGKRIAEEIKTRVPSVMIGFSKENRKSYKLMTKSYRKQAFLMNVLSNLSED